MRPSRWKRLPITRSQPLSDQFILLMLGRRVMTDHHSLIASLISRWQPRRPPADQANGNLLAWASSPAPIPPCHRLNPSSTNRISRMKPLLSGNSG